MERNEDNFCFNGIGMPEVHDDLEENLTAEVGGQWVAVFDGIGGLPRGEEASYLAPKQRWTKNGHGRSRTSRITKPFCFANAEKNK